LRTAQGLKQVAAQPLRGAAIPTAARKTASSIGCWRLRLSWRACIW